MHKYNEEFIEKAFELIPEANWIVVDRDRNCHLYENKPHIAANIYICLSGESFYLGQVIPICDWKDSLRARKWVPKNQETYYLPDPTMPEMWSTSFWKHNYDNDMYRFNKNLIYRTKEEAILACDKMLAAVRK